MSLSRESLDLFAQLLSLVKLDATDPDLEVKAALIGRVRTELATALGTQVDGQSEQPTKPEHNGRVTKPARKRVST